MCAVREIIQGKWPSSYFPGSASTNTPNLSQFPLEGTRRADFVVVKFNNFVADDLKYQTEKFDVARRETRYYTICGTANSSHKFPYGFGLPICPTKILLEMHIIVGDKLEYIHFDEPDDMKKLSHCTI